VRTLALDDPELLLQRYKPPLIIDEVQHAPGLLSHLKPLVDRSGKMGEYWLSGSQHFPLMEQVSEALAGRKGIVELLGMSQAEELRIRSADDPFRPDRAAEDTTRTGLDLPRVFERIVRGSLPRLLHTDAPPVEAYHDAYLQTYIERDVRAMQNIADLAAFRRFIKLAAARIGQLLNVSDLARDTGISVSTARNWLSLLQATFQVVLLPPYFENIGKRQIKTPKLYFADTGIACFLAGWRTAETAASGAMAGALFENYVVVEVLKSYRHRGRTAPLYFFRTKEKQEVDLLIAEDGLLFPIEIKLTASPGTRDLAGIRALRRSGAPLGPGAVVCLAQQRVPLDASVDIVPIGEIG